MTRGHPSPLQSHQVTRDWSTSCLEEPHNALQVCAHREPEHCCPAWPVPAIVPKLAPTQHFFPGEWGAMGWRSQQDEGLIQDREGRMGEHKDPRHPGMSPGQQVTHLVFPRVHRAALGHA